MCAAVLAEAPAATHALDHSVDLSVGAATGRQAGRQMETGGMVWYQQPRARCVHPLRCAMLCCAVMCRLCFPQITAVAQRLIDTLSGAGPSAVHDMDAVAAAITVDVIGLAAFNRDLQATCSLPTPAQPVAHTQGATQAAAAAAATPPAPAGADASGLDSSSTAAGSSTAPPAAAGICGSVPFPRGREVLNVISHLVVAMQARNNPLNRWIPWRQVRGVRHGCMCVWICVCVCSKQHLLWVLQHPMPPNPVMTWIESRGWVRADCWLAALVSCTLQAHKDLFKWGGRMSGLVQDLTASMEATPPPTHSLGAHLLKAHYSTGVP